MLQVQGLTAERGGRQLFTELTFALNAGECLHVQGPNGVGKTTLLKALAGLTNTHCGVVSWQGKSQSDWGDDFAANLHYLGHRDALKDTLSPLENLLTLARLQGVGLSENAALQALLKVGLAACIDLPVRQLSQGQKRRAALARFLALPRPLWIMDEPLVALDIAAQAELGQWLAEHLSGGGIALLTSHQEIPELIPAPRILLLEAM
ncbi:cytochrome c biogenesis heme-transporting ATPase CcmA [Chitinibacter bivalviorum]|uniref:Cytochrome c biogenesis heme-transporting ATPase CcmA n=1 Tax=Chitinibacter bivalviorum TaxID=2739434 RepID=A0A7H9BHF4_9NEIS|nr:cytochrome c biogenesis heme-transporting ATPase CcmA [Chitinibacter bivalviorum]QLG87762.1 cytochrome c biogenesis heme-transporting ATPase CcmA [Chitinibacter bivalviorum]